MPLKTFSALSSTTSFFLPLGILNSPQNLSKLKGSLQLEQVFLMRCYTTLQSLIVPPIPLGFVIRHLVQQKDIVVGAVAGADAPLGVNAFAPGHRQTVRLPTFIIVAHQLEIIFQRNRRLWVLRDQVRTWLAPPLVETGYDSVAHHEIHAVRGRLDRFTDGLKAIGFGHLDATDEVWPDVAFAENVHLIDEAFNPTIPTHTPVLPWVDPFEKPSVPHLHVRVMAIHARGAVALHGFFVLGVGLQVDEAPPPAPLERRRVLRVEGQLVLAVQGL